MTRSRTRERFLLLPLLLVATSAAAACARPVATTTPMPMAASTYDSVAVARARADSARHPYTAADVRFMTSMIGHHAQALVMTAMVPSHGASPSVRTLADRITSAQQDEIATMQRWLRDRLQPVPMVSASGAVTMTMPAMPGHDMSGHDMSGHDMSGHDMSGHDMGAHALMPGMLTPAQLAELDRARGAEFDRLFLTFMIQHHRGATSMVEQLFATDGAGQDETIFKFASDVNVDQSTEIARMQRMLVALALNPQQ